MTTEVSPSITGSSSWWLRKMPTNATTRPSSAAVSSNSTVKRLGSLPWWIAASVRLLPLVLRNTRHATLNEYASKTHRDGEHDVVDGRVLELHGMLDVRDALVDGHAAADAEDAHGDDEAPEVDLHAVTEGVLLVGRPRAPV